MGVKQNQPCHFYFSWGKKHVTSPHAFPGRSFSSHEAGGHISCDLLAFFPYHMGCMSLHPTMSLSGSTLDTQITHLVRCDSSKQSLPSEPSDQQDNPIPQTSHLLSVFFQQAAPENVTIILSLGGNIGRFLARCPKLNPCQWRRNQRVLIKVMWGWGHL